MDPTRRQIIDDIIHDAHHGRDRIVSSEVAAEVVDEVRNLEAAGHRWVADLIDKWLIAGAAKACADWRRRYQHAGRTNRGTEVEVPVYGAVRETSADGEIVHVQLALFTMTVEQVKERHATLARQRDTLSAEVRWFADLIEVMEARGCQTAGDAIALMEAA